MTFCNDRWFELTHTTKRAFEEVDISEGFFEADVVKLFQTMTDAVKNREVNTVEMRLQKDWIASDGRRAQAWVMASIFAEFADDDSFQGCTGTLTDISEFKYSDTLQRRRLEDALEAKRQQENFIDMTSHEMRNPLSAMVQCADSVLAAVIEINDILKSMTASQMSPLISSKLFAEIETGLEGIQTIISCCAHQKCIIDDVLTLSKLDSNLLAITPVQVEPAKVMQEVAKMFDMDAQKADVTLATENDETIDQLKIEWLMMDPSRVKQILINLVSNAIKFTRTQAIRNVVLRMSASLRIPTGGTVKYVPAERSVNDEFLTTGEWGTGEVVYLQFSVEDTGRGTGVKEQHKLFHRFSQASPRTHVEYGGSGLGLFITRQLTELQGGEVGVVSEEQKGSTFAFYIRTRRTSTPQIFSEASTSATHPSRPTGVTGHVSPTLNSSADVGGANNKVTVPGVPIPSFKPRILIVEDNMVNQRVLSTQLKRLGCTTFTAGHGQEALDFLRTTPLWCTANDVVEENAPDDTLLVDIILMDVSVRLWRAQCGLLRFT